MHYIIPRRLVRLGRSLVVTIPQFWIPAHTPMPTDEVLSQLPRWITILLSLAKESQGRP